MRIWHCTGTSAILRSPLMRTGRTLGQLPLPFLLLRDGHCFRDTALSACDRARLHPRIVFESGQFSSLLSMVGVGMGVSIVPEMAIDKKSGCAYVRLADDRAVRTIGVARLRGRSCSRAQNAFLTRLRGGD